MNFLAPANYAAAVAMMGQTVTMPNGAAGRIASAGSSGDAFHLAFVGPDAPGHIWIAHWHSARGFTTAAAEKARAWDLGAARLNQTERRLIVAVFGDVFAREDRAGLIEPARLVGAAKARLIKQGRLELDTCGRCGGSGHYSRCEMYGTTCFGCAGKGKAMPSAGKALRAALTCEAVAA